LLNNENSKVIFNEGAITQYYTVEGREPIQKI